MILYTKNIINNFILKEIFIITISPLHIVNDSFLFKSRLLLLKLFNII